MAFPGALAFGSDVASESATKATAPAPEVSTKPTVEAPPEAPDPVDDVVEEPVEEPSKAAVEEPVDDPAEEPAEVGSPKGDPVEEDSRNRDEQDRRQEQQQHEGTVKIEGVDIDDIPQNAPHQGCTFTVEWRGFEGGGQSTATFTLVAPTPGGSISRTVTLQNDPAGGANDLDAVLTMNVLELVESVEPHPIQGHHIRLDVTLPDGTTKSKVFWVTGCVGGEEPEPGIQIFKSCPEAVEVGETINYEITIVNTGNEDLDIQSVIDSLLGDITDQFSDVLAVDAQETVTVPFDTTGLEPGDLLNEVEVVAVGAESGTGVSDAAQCLLELVGPPEFVADVDVAKDCPPVARIGSTIVYDITVTNTGTDPLVGLSVEDTLLGDLSDSFPASLDPGDSVTRSFARDAQPGDPDPLTNTVTVTALGSNTGATVSDVDSCRTNLRPPIGGVVPPEPPIIPRGGPGLGGLPVTGADMDVFLRLFVVLTLAGLGLLYLDQRRERDAQVAYATAQGPVIPGGMLTYGARSLLGEDAEIPNAREVALGLATFLALASGAAATRREEL